MKHGGLISSQQRRNGVEEGGKQTQPREDIGVGDEEGHQKFLNIVAYR